MQPFRHPTTAAISSSRALLLWLQEKLGLDDGRMDDLLTGWLTDNYWANIKTYRRRYLVAVKKRFTDHPTCWRKAGARQKGRRSSKGEQGCAFTPQASTKSTCCSSKSLHHNGRGSGSFPPTRHNVVASRKSSKEVTFHTICLNKSGEKGLVSSHLQIAF